MNPNFSSSVTDDLFTHAPAFALVLDSHGIIQQANAMWHQLLEPARLLKTPMLDWIHPQERRTAKNLFHDLHHSSAAQHSLCCRWSGDQRQYRWLHLQFTILPDNRIYAVGLDVTERENQLQQISDSESRYALAIQGADQALWDWNLNTNTLYFSPRWKTMLGYEPEELADHFDTLAAHMIPSEFTQLWGALEAYLDKRNPFFESMHRLRHREGHYLWFMIRGVALWDEHDQPYRMVGTYTNMTHHKQQEQNLRQSEAQLRLVTSRAPIILFALDQQGYINFLRGSVLPLLDLDPEQLIGHSLFEQQTPFVDNEQVRLALLGQSCSRMLDLTELVLETQCNPLFNETGEVIGVLGLSIDMTERYALELRLTEAIGELETIIDNSMVGIAYVKRGLFIRVNRKLEQLLDYEANALCGLPFSTLFPNTTAYQDLAKQAYPRFARDESYDATHLLKNRLGQSLWGRLVGRGIDVQKSEKASIWLIEDISLQRQAEQHLRLAAAVFETSADAIYVTDLQNRIQRINPAFTRITGYTAEEVYGRDASFLASGRHDASFIEHIWHNVERHGYWQGEVWNRKKSGEVHVSWLSFSAIKNEKGEPLQYMSILTDISRLQEDIENARYLANYDSLTGLPNRLLFHDHLQQAQTKARRYGRLFALLFIDLDGFKPINDQYGHTVGDRLLHSVGERLQLTVRETDRVARLGGDEFTVIANDIRQIEDAARVAEKIIQQFTEPFELGSYKASVSASIGITIYPEDSNNIDMLIKYADDAMYRAKAKGKACYAFYQARPATNTLQSLPHLMG
jgi:diguanylate cyclase (GGDEF)-like protein/PAS domain S-box-containing protein